MIVGRVSQVAVIEGLIQCLDKLRISGSSDIEPMRRPAAMIGSAIERGSLICVYDQHGITLFSKARGSGAKDGLLGFTGSTVTVRFGSIIYTYDERGMTIYAKAA
jgi:hypothetical protein